jgi:hypothetical protein
MVMEKEESSTKQKKKFWIRWGMSFVMLILLFLVAIILDVVKIRTKVMAEVIVEKSECIVYITKDPGLKIRRGDTLEIEVSGGIDIPFVIGQICEEPDNMVCRVTPVKRDLLERCLSGNTKLQGYIFTHYVKLLNLVFAKKIGL